MSDAVTPPRANGARRRPMAAVDRRHRILERVAEDQTIQVGELALAFDVSEMTIRRDIARLERDGFVRQTYGGATAHLTRSLDVAFNARALEHTREKRLIGMRATTLLEDARVVFVGIGTTAEQFARFLPARQDLTVVTASLPIASLLGHPADRRGGPRRGRPPGRADLRRPGRRGHARPVPLRPGRRRRGRCLRPAGD